MTARHHLAPGSLLVSVRSAAEARRAVEGGAAIIDIKEPSRGSLGMADPQVWQAVREVVPPAVALSVALGELNEWKPQALPSLRSEDWTGLSFRKLGLSQAPPDWRRRWDELRDRLGPGPAWVAVAYHDWQRASSPHPDQVLEAAIESSDCAGLLIDTWDKRDSPPLTPDRAFVRAVEQLHSSGRFLAVAGRLDLPTIDHYRGLLVDIFAVRGAACRDGDRHAEIETARVLALAQAARAASLISSRS